jgi:hypothetical protein
VRDAAQAASFAAAVVCQSEVLTGADAQLRVDVHKRMVFQAISHVVTRKVAAYLHYHLDHLKLLVAKAFLEESNPWSKA